VYDSVDWKRNYLVYRLWRRAVMPNTYTAITKKDGDWWIGWIEEVPGVNCQERTREELVDTLRITLKEALELNRREAIDAAETGFTEVQVTV
jgi:predicted RNase H-like HicB family nuclease